MRRNKIFLLFLIANVLYLSHLKAQTKHTLTYEIIPGKNDSDIVYRGPVTFNDIKLVPAFHFDESVKDYKPKSSAIKALQGNLSQYKLNVFLGTWCADSHIMLPELYKVLLLTAYPLDSLSLFALDRDKHTSAGQEMPYKITLVPTIIVLKDGKEMGRITEMPQKSVEKDLLKIISQ